MAIKVTIKVAIKATIKVAIKITIKVIGPEEMPILVWGWRKRPQTKMGST